MKKIFIVCLLIFCGICHAESIFIYNNQFISDWTFQIVYKEKYFENSKYYVKYNILDEYVLYKDDFYSEILTGLEHNVLFRLGVPNNYILNICADLIFQKAGILDYNNLQTIDFYFEKRINLFNIIAGFKLPLWFEMVDSPYLIDKRKQFNILLGFVFDWNYDFLKITFMFFNQENINNYFDTKDIIFTIGFDFISNELQNIGFYIENDLRIYNFNNLPSYIYYFIPQIKVNFLNNFCILAGIEFYLLAENVFVNKYDKQLYVFKLNYMVNSDKKEKKEMKEEQKVKFEKKKWWQIEGIDDEMIPQSWKEMEEPQWKK